MSMEHVLSHHGILGQKWGIRRYQNPDGSLTSAGKKRYLTGEKIKPMKSDSSVTRRVKADYNKMSDNDFKRKYKTSKETYRKRVNRYGDPYENAPLAKMGKAVETIQKKNKNGDYDKQKKILKEIAIGAVSDRALAIASYKAMKYFDAKTGSKDIGDDIAAGSLIVEALLAGRTVKNVIKIARS